MTHHQDGMDSEADYAAYQELRFALALNGGVSLAVWMGGVVMECNRIVLQDPLRREKAPGGPVPASGAYGELLKLTRTTPRFDVIAGASAGGLNGALLAAAMVYQRDLASVRDLWLE
ncbi:MAG TPA: patatin-like phospholipase family protein, partial [Actinomycetota bacterium]